MAPLKASPTLRRDAARRFSAWLRKRYGSQAGLREAWGERAFDSFGPEGFQTRGESIDEGTVLPLGNPWFWDPAQLAGSQAFRRRRLLDTLAFLYETQCAFYDRFAKAVRDAGYEGEIIASNWQAGRALGHFYNLHSDARIGAIDRHNYVGGGAAKPGERFQDASILRAAGSEILSTGLQQVADRPFILSEWIHVFPNEWGVEGPALVGAYGLGLQGWDASFLFQNGDAAGFSERIGRDRWDAMAPQILGIFPAVARQVLRGDLKESSLSARMYVHIPSLAEGKLGFEDRIAQVRDLEAFDCDKVPARALAVARCAVEFVDAYRETPPFDIRPFERHGALVSSTGELRWKEGGEERLSGYFTIDTAATKAVVGFARGETLRLGDVTIAPACRFAAIYVTAAEKDATIATARRLIVVAMARARNSGMRFDAAEHELLARGEPPILLEPVRARIAIRGLRIRAANLLDHDGRRTDRTLPVADGAFEIDGARDRTPYYEILGGEG